MLWIILGDYGSGKTLFLVLQGFSSKRDVWGNFYLDLDRYTQIEPMDFRNLGSRKLVLLDEMQTWLESRVSMSFLNLYVTNIIDQTDKRDVDVFGTAHLFGSVDRRFRENVHRIVRCERVGKLPLGRTRKEDFRDFRFRIMNTYTGKIIKKRLKYSKAIKYFPKYSTSEIIEYPNQKDLELDLLLKINPAEAYNRLLEIAKDIDSNGGLTHANMELVLLQNGYSAKHGRLVYALVKKLKEDHTNL